MSAPLVALLAGAASLLSPPAPEDWLPADLDGRPDVDAFAGVVSATHERLRSGDAELAYARQAADASARDRHRVACFEAWRSALEGTAGQLVPWTAVPATEADRAPGTDGGWSERFFEGVEEAVLRRLAVLTPEERADRAERLSGLAEAALERAAHQPRALAAVEREHPGLRGALGAALRLGDLALESGRRTDARAWYERAARHTRLGAAGASPEATHAALARRQAVCAERPPSKLPPAWETATALELVHVLSLVPGQRLPDIDPPRGARIARRSVDPGGGLRSGLTLLPDGRAVILGERYLTFVEPGTRASLRTVDWTEWLLEALALPEGPPPVWARREPPGWAPEPIALGGAVALVLGRGNNLLVAVQPPPVPGAPPRSAPRSTMGSAPGSALEPPRLVWAAAGIEGALHVRGPSRPPSEATPLAGLSGSETLVLEFQPGGVRVGETLIVEARQLGDGVRSTLVALDARTGSLLWSSFLAKGADRVPEGAPGRDERALPLASQPLARVGTRVFAGTHLGTGFLVDAVDGRRVWALAARRRDVGADGWTGARPVVVPPVALSGTDTGANTGSPTLLWAPADAAHLYQLRAGLDALTEGPWKNAPLELDSLYALLGGDARGLLFSARSGARQTLRELDVASGGRFDALHFGAGEQVNPSARVGSERVLTMTDTGLYLLDRRSLSSEPLPELNADLERASLYTHAEHVLVLAGEALFVFRSARGE